MLRRKPSFPGGCFEGQPPNGYSVRRRRIIVAPPAITTTIDTTASHGRYEGLVSGVGTGVAVGANGEGERACVATGVWDADGATIAVGEEAIVIETAVAEVVAEGAAAT